MLLFYKSVQLQAVSNRGLENYHRPTVLVNSLHLLQCSQARGKLWYILDSSTHNGSLYVGSIDMLTFDKKFCQVGFRNPGKRRKGTSGLFNFEAVILAAVILRKSRKANCSRSLVKTIQ